MPPTTDPVPIALNLILQKTVTMSMRGLVVNRAGSDAVSFRERVLLSTTCLLFNVTGMLSMRLSALTCSSRGVRIMARAAPNISGQRLANDKLNS
jgi:hypothetical protein